MGTSIAANELIGPISPEQETHDFARLKSYWAPILGYAALLSGLYLHGYWIEFGVRPLEYIGTSDVLKVAAYPLGIVLILYLMSIAFGLILGLATSLAESHAHRMGRRMVLRLVGRNRSIRKVDVLIRRSLADAHRSITRWGWILLVGVPTIMFITSDEHAIVLFGLIIACVIASLAIAVESRGAKPKAAAGLLGVAFALFLPFVALDAGISAAHRVERADIGTVRIDAERSRLPLTSDRNNPVVHLGLLGNTHFMLESATKKTVVVAAPLKHPMYMLPPGIDVDGSQQRGQSAKGAEVVKP